jgi:hypothetical protein
MFVLSRPAFCGNDSTTVHASEVAIGKLIPALGVLTLFSVDREMPFPILLEPMQADKVIFFLGGRLVFTPSVPFVYRDFPLFDKLFREIESPFV